jgi:preprotein translocase subunit SecE
MLAKNIFIWALIALVTITNMAIQFFWNFNSTFQVIGWLCNVLIVCSLFLFTESFSDLKVLAIASYNEVKKIVWPTKQETVQTTLIVIIMVAVTGTMLWLLDNFMIWLIAKLARLG